MKYRLELSGQDINLINAALSLREESAIDCGNKHWEKKWRELKKRINKKMKTPNL